MKQTNRKYCPQSRFSQLQLQSIHAHKLSPRTHGVYATCAANGLIFHGGGSPVGHLNGDAHQVRDSGYATHMLALAEIASRLQTARCKPYDAQLHYRMTHIAGVLLLLLSLFLLSTTTSTYTHFAPLRCVRMLCGSVRPPWYNAKTLLNYWDSLFRDL